MIGSPENTGHGPCDVKIPASGQGSQAGQLCHCGAHPGTEFHDLAVKGEKGVRLMTEDFSEYRRYGSAVTTVGDLTPTDLIDLQNEGFVSIYSAPWRWVPMLQKHGVIGGTLMLLRWRNCSQEILWRIRRSIASHQLVSLGDGRFGHIQDPQAMATGGCAISESNSGISTCRLAEPFSEITPSKAAAPAGHFGDPRNPNG